MIGRSHGIHAEPTTMGLKFTLMSDEFTRALERLEVVRENVAVGKLSGSSRYRKTRTFPRKWEALRL